VIWLFVIGTKEILANNLTAEKFLRQQLIYPIVKSMCVTNKIKESATDLADSVKLPDLELLQVCLGATQKNNGSQLIACVYLFFEMLTEEFLN